METEIRSLELKYMPVIKEHINIVLNNMYNKGFDIIPSSDYEDSNLSFDIKFNWSFVISVRIRKNKYMMYNDITIRKKSKNNGKTEFDKIKEGMANLYYYAYQNINETDIVKAYIVDVSAIRRLINKGKFTTHKNTDNTGFAGFKIEDIKNEGGLIKSF